MMERVAIHVLIFQAFHKHVVSGLKQQSICIIDSIIYLRTAKSCPFFLIPHILFYYILCYLVQAYCQFL